MNYNVSVSFIVPCYNESSKIKSTFNTIEKVIVKNNILNYQIIFIDDCSKDNTFKELEQIRDINQNVIILKNKKNVGFGGSFFNGLKFSKCSYSMLLPGDDAHLEKDISKMILGIDDNDYVITYYTNPKDRVYSRYLFTKLYTPFLNFIFNTKIPYFNGINIYKTDILKSLNISNSSFSFQIEIILNFISLNKKLSIIPTFLNEDKRKKSISKAFSLKNCKLVIKEIFKLYLRYRLKL